MEQVFSIGHDIWSFFQAIFSPEQYPEWIQQGWPIGLGLVVMLILIYALKSRSGQMQRRQQLEALEEALLDEDLEDRSLELPDRPLEDENYPEYSEDDDNSGRYDEPATHPMRGTVARDPEFGGKIVIGADSSRKPSPETEPEYDSQEAPPVSTASSLEEIDQEFAQFAQELKEKANEVQRRHQIEDELMESELFEEDFEQEERPAPITLSAADILPENSHESTSDWNQELDDLLEEPENGQGMGDEELLDGLRARSDEQEELERDPLEIKERNEQLIQRLEEFQKDFEHKIQSATLSQLAQKNFELVESLSDSQQAREYQVMKRNQMESISSLESMVFGTDKKKR